MPDLTRLYCNPVLDLDFPDIGVLKRAEGYYAYASQGCHAGRMVTIQGAFSRDLVRWRYLGEMLPSKPRTAPDQDYWAPDVVELAPDAFRMFFNARTKHGGHGIYVATARRPWGPFVAHDTPLVAAPSYQAIDAHAFRDPADGAWYLLWGSCRRPITIRAMAPDLCSFAPGSQAVAILVPDEAETLTVLYEAAWLHARADPRDGHIAYFLFTSGPDAFAPDGYTVQVARSTEGPCSGFHTRAAVLCTRDSIVYRGNGSFMNPGAGAITRDSAGHEWALNHGVLRTAQLMTRLQAASADQAWAILRAQPRVMLLDAVRYEAGWPNIGDGSPSRESVAPAGYSG